MVSAASDFPPKRQWVADVPKFSVKQAGHGRGNVSIHIFIGSIKRDYRSDTSYSIIIGEIE